MTTPTARELELLRERGYAYELRFDAKQQAATMLHQCIVGNAPGMECVRELVAPEQLADFERWLGAFRTLATFYAEQRRNLCLQLERGDGISREQAAEFDRELLALDAALERVARQHGVDAPDLRALGPGGGCPYVSSFRQHPDPLVVYSWRGILSALLQGRAINQRRQ